MFQGAAGTCPGGELIAREGDVFTVALADVTRLVARDEQGLRSGHGVLCRQRPLAHLGREDGKRQRTGRLIRADVLAVRFTAVDEQRSSRAQRGPPAQGDGHGLRDHIALE
jgi:hypothetical protein